MPNYSTEFCIVCLKPAVVYSGHVLKGKEQVLAGFCKKHECPQSSPHLLQRAGCFGYWGHAYGLKKDK